MSEGSSMNLHDSRGARAALHEAMSAAISGVGTIDSQTNGSPDVQTTGTETQASEPSVNGHVIEELANQELINRQMVELELKDEEAKTGQVEGSAASIQPEVEVYGQPVEVTIKREDAEEAAPASCASEAKKEAGQPDACCDEKKVQKYVEIDGPCYVNVDIFSISGQAANTSQFSSRVGQSLMKMLLGFREDGFDRNTLQELQPYNYRSEREFRSDRVGELYRDRVTSARLASLLGFNSIGQYEAIHLACFPQRIMLEIADKLSDVAQTNGGMRGYVRFTIIRNNTHYTFPMPVNTTLAEVEAQMRHNH